MSRVNSGLNGVNGGFNGVNGVAVVTNAEEGVSGKQFGKWNISVPKNIRGWLGISLHQFSTNGKSSSWFGCSAGTVNGWMIRERCEMLWVK